MIKTLSFKLYNSRKNKYLHQKIDISGKIYNHLIALNRKYYNLFKKRPSKYQIQKHITKLKKLKKYTFWKIVPSQSIQDITDRIERAYILFFSNLKNKIKCSPPSFKKVKKYKSITLKQAGYKLLEKNKIKIQSQIYKYFKSREIPKNIKTITIKRNLIGDVYLFISIDIKESKDHVLTGKIAGFDFGLKTFLTSSDKKKIISPEFFKNSLKKIKRAHKNLSRKKLKSKNRIKARIDLARIYKKLSDSRKDFFFKLAHDITDKYDYIFLEDLNLKGMKKLWGRKISDLAFYEFMLILKYIANKKGKTVHQVDRFFPSSRLCSNCNEKNKTLSLKERVWTCTSCNKKHDRDVNAAINNAREGASSLGLDIVRLDSSSEYCLNPESN